MINELSVALEDNFNFSPLSRLSQTAEKIADSTGTIHYIPTNYPLPLSKRALSSVVDEYDQVRALPMPKSEDDLQERIFAGIDYLLEHNGDASVVFFCPSQLVTKISNQRGSKFVQIKEVTIQDPNHERVNIYRDLTGNSTAHIETDFAPFLLKAYLSTLVEEEPSLTKFKTTATLENWDIYLSYDSLTEVSVEMQDFFLESIGIRNRYKFFSLPENAQKNVFAVAFVERYGTIETNERTTFLKTWKNQEPEVSALFRELAATKLTKGRLFNSRLLELTDHGGRDFVEKVQTAYTELFETDDKINQKDPSVAADRLIQRFGILYHDAPDEEIEALLAKIRSKLSEDAVHVTEYSQSKIPDILQRVETMLQRTKEAYLVTESTVIESSLQSDSWTDSLEKIYREQTGGEDISNLDVEYVPALEEAKRRVHIDLEYEDDAKEIQAMSSDFENLPLFIEEWAEFLCASQGDEVTNDTYREAIVEKYDEFCDTLVSDYKNIINEEEHFHLTNLLSPSEKLRIVVIIDSLGYTDIELMKQWDLLETSPDVQPIFSNIPSYTPSAMASVLTGLTAEETGIYNWAVRENNEIRDLKNRHNADELDFIDQSTELSYYLLQEQDLMTSGITRFAQQVADLKLHDGFSKGESLEDVYSTVESEIETVLKKRYEAFTGNDDIPEEHRRQKLNAQKSTFVVYLPDFDSLLHDDLSLFEFQSYYSTLGKFIDDLSDELLDHLQKYSHEEDYELIFAGDHGKITRYEQELIEEVRTQEPFHQSMLKDLVELEPYHYLNFDRASFTDREGKVTIAVGNIEEEALLDKARKQVDEPVSDDDLLKIVETDSFVVSGSKFLFGWKEKPGQTLDLDRFGYDTYRPRGNGIFDSPTIGLLSRYQDKNTPRAHAYHGGTSISEMTAAKLTYTENDA